MKYKIKKQMLFWVIIACTFSCKNNKTNLTPSISMPYEVLERSALPEQTDPAITTQTLGNTRQFAYVPKEESVRKNKIFIFIPGTFANPSVYKKIIQSAAKFGYYSIGVSYSNMQTIESQCNNNNSETCVSNILKEYLEGTDSSPDVSITPANSFENRISKFILFLKNNNPNENWGQFLDNNNKIKWEMVSLAGHSQGSGHTTYISKVRSLFRAGIFSGPNGFQLSNGRFPTWFISNGLTSNDKVFAFTNRFDGLTPYTSVSAAWNGLNLIGSPLSIDGVSSFGNAHRLITDVRIQATAGSANPEHGSTVADAVTPVDNRGNPTFEVVWKYMCFPDE
jgi:hypothetical protein